MSQRLRLLLCFLLLLSAQLFAAPEAALKSDARWAEAHRCYKSDNLDEGHRLLISLADSRPGDMGLAVACYAAILGEEGRPLKSNPWIDLAADRLMALEQFGAISANTELVHEAVSRVMDRDIREGKHLEARAASDRFLKENPNDLYWRVRHAYNYRRMDLLDTLPLYQKLKEEYDPDHPHPATRELWAWMQPELKAIGQLPNPCLLYTSPSPRDATLSRMPSSA